jgi:hypothetical protein
MIPFIGLLSTPKAKLIALAAIVIVAFIAGWKVNGWRHDAKENEKVNLILKQKAIEEKQNRELIASLQAKKQQIITKEVVRYAKIKDVTDDRVCFADWGAVRLWNDALSGQESVASDTAGTTNPTGNASATDTEILENLNINAARWERLREQMNAIIEWDKKTFGER